MSEAESGREVPARRVSNETKNPMLDVGNNRKTIGRVQSVLKNSVSHFEAMFVRIF